MIFRQLFDSTSSTYTYLLASRQGGEALIIDPVLEKVDRYIQLLNELDLRLVAQQIPGECQVGRPRPTWSRSASPTATRSGSRA